MDIEAIAYARTGAIGNPSDAFFGKTIGIYGGVEMLSSLRAAFEGVGAQVIEPIIETARQH